MFPEPLENLHSLFVRNKIMGAYHVFSLHCVGGNASFPFSCVERLWERNTPASLRLLLEEEEFIGSFSQEWAHA